MLRLVGIGALGNMLSPAAKHLNNLESPGRFIRILDRNPLDVNKQERRENWLAHGACLVSSYEELMQGQDYEGVVICAGKNGDDLPLISKIITLILQNFQSNKPFILHCSTVSVEFVAAAFNACQKHNILYANYPLTGGSKGALAGTMLILASGQRSLFDALSPMLNKLGKPNYFDAEVTTAAKVKLIGHLMVFNGLLGMSSAVALQNLSIPLRPESQSDFFDFLNQGAGGSRQWDVALKPAVRDHQWEVGFLLPHAVIDAIYTVDLLLKYQMPTLTILPILQLAAAFSYVMQTSGPQVATQSLLKALVETPEALEKFIQQQQDYTATKFLDNVIHSLPKTFQDKVKLDITEGDFLE